MASKTPAPAYARVFTDFSRIGRAETVRIAGKHAPRREPVKMIKMEAMARPMLYPSSSPRSQPSSAGQVSSKYVIEYIVDLMQNM